MTSQVSGSPVSISEYRGEIVAVRTADDPDLCARLRREASILRRLRIPGVVALVDYLEDPVTGGRRDPVTLRRLNEERRRVRLRRSPRRFVSWFATNPARLRHSSEGFDWKSHPAYPPDLLRGD